MNKVKKGYLFNIISVAILSLTPILNKLSLTDLSAIKASFFNALFSTLILLITVLLDKSKIKIYHNKFIWLLVITNTIGILLQYVSLSLLDPVSVGLLGRFYIIFALFLSVLFLNETLCKNDTLPIIFAVIGTFLITHFSGDFNSILGVIVALSYTFFFALTNILAKKTVKDIDSKTILLYNRATSTLLLMKELYFDLAGKALPYQLPNITQCVDMDKIIYGSDAPYTTDQVVTMLADELERTDLLSHHELEEMFYDNGKQLLKSINEK